MVIRRIGSVSFSESPIGNYPMVAQYIYVLLLSDSQIAWEYLRRNLAYQRDYKISAEIYEIDKLSENLLIQIHNLSIEKPTLEDKENIKEEIDLLINRVRSIDRADLVCPPINRWGLLELENPHVQGDETTLFWNPDICGSIVKYIVDRNKLWRGRRRSLSDTQSHLTVLLKDNAHYANLDYYQEVVRLYGHESPFLRGDERLSLERTPWQSESAAAAAKKRINRIWRGAKRKYSTAEVSNYRKDRLKHMYQLFAVDGANAGVKLSKIAEKIYGDRFIQDRREGNNRYLNAIKRYVKRANHLISMGYIELLRYADS